MEVDKVDTVDNNNHITSNNPLHLSNKLTTRKLNNGLSYPVLSRDSHLPASHQEALVTLDQARLRHYRSVEELQRQLLV
jgi:hypothetical protein